MVASLSEMLQYLQAQNDNSAGSQIAKGLEGIANTYTATIDKLNTQDRELAEKVAQERRERMLFGMGDQQNRDKTQGGLILAKNGEAPNTSNQPGPMETMAMQFTQKYPNQAKFTSAVLSQPATMHSFSPEDKVTYNSKGEFTVTRGGNVTAEKPNKPIYYRDANNRVVDRSGKEVIEVPANADIQPYRDSDKGEVLGEVRKARLHGSLINSFNNDAAVKKARISMDAAATIKDLAESGNPIAAASIPTYSARMAGEVGNLSEADKRPFGGSSAIDQKIKRSLKEMATGQLSDDNRRFIVELTEIIDKRNRENMARTAKRMSKQYGKTGKYGSEEEIFDMLMPDYTEIEKEAKIEKPAGTSMKSKYGLE